MGERGSRGACPSSAGFMHTLGMAASYCAVFLEGLLILRGRRSGLFRLFPLFYSYIIYAFCGTLVMYGVYWRYPREYPSAYWIYYLISILVEFSVLVEISDHIFQFLPAVRHLGRALTIIISAALGLIYMLPVILWSPGMRNSLFGFALRASITKAIILMVLFCGARQFGLQLGKNVGGLMLGFAIYVATYVVLMATAKVFSSALFGPVFWFMAPLAFTLCALVWTVSLWDLAPASDVSTRLPVLPRDSASVALELTRFNDELSKFLRK
jgi:hypothetical protein